MSKYEDAVAMWKEKNISNDAELSEALSTQSITFAYHSGRIENEKITYNDTREIFEHDGVTSYTGDLRTLFEIRNSRDAHELMLSSFKDRRLLDEALLKEFHFELSKNTYDARRWQLGERPGEYKKHDFVTGRYEIGALPEDVPEEIGELLDEFKEVPEEKALTLAAYFHAKFENIHPFADGNGRVGRLVMNYLLILHNHPLIIIHQEDKKGYYTALEAWDRSQELKPLIAFLTEQAEKTWENRIQREDRGK